MSLALCYALRSMLLLTKPKKAVAFWYLGYGIRDYLRFYQTRVAALEKLHQHSVVNVLVKITNINLEITLWCRLELSKLTYWCVFIWQRSWLQFLKLVFRTVTCPIQLIRSLSTWNASSVKVHIHIFRNLVVWKLNKTITNRGSLDLVSN